MKLLNTKLTAVNLKSHIMEVQVATANTCRHLKRLKESACVWGRLCSFQREKLKVRLYTRNVKKLKII